MIYSPQINGTQVTFTYSGNATTVFVVGEHTLWEKEDQMTQTGEDLWTLAKEFPINARIEYKFVVDGNWIKDPANNNKDIGNSGNSILIMPGYKSDYEQIICQNIPSGDLIRDVNIYSRSLKCDVQHSIYLPPNHKKERPRHILYALDGNDFINFANIHKILDYMIFTGEIPSVVGVFANPKERQRDYTIYKPYLSYVLNELMPQVEGEYLFSEIQRSIIGVSWGGLTAIFTAIMSEGRFNQVLSQSGSFWPKNWRIFDLLENAELSKIKFVLQTGTVQDTEEMNDDMFRTLTTKGAQVKYEKFAESHSWSNWKGHLHEGLKDLFALFTNV